MVEHSCQARCCAGRHEAAAGASGTERETFLHSLVCNVAPDASLLRCSEDAADAPPSWRSTPQQDGGGGWPPAGGGSRANRPPSSFPAIDAFLPTVCNQVPLNWTRGRIADCLRLSLDRLLRSQQRTPRALLEARGPSFGERCTLLIGMLWSPQGGSCSWVRSWMAMDSHVLLYGIGGNRYDAMAAHALSPLSPGEAC